MPQNVCITCSVVSWGSYQGMGVSADFFYPDNAKPGFIEACKNGF